MPGIWKWQLGAGGGLAAVLSSPLFPSPPPNHIWPGPPWSDSHIPSTRPGLAGIASLHEIFLPKKAPICNIYLPKTLNLCFKVSIQSFWRINCGFCQVLGRVVSPGRRIISGEAGQEHHICLRGGGYRGLCPALFSLSLSLSLSLEFSLHIAQTLSYLLRRPEESACDTHTHTHTHTLTQAGYYHTMKIEQTIY